MSRRKPISKRGVSGSSERAALLTLMTTPCRSENCPFKEADHYLCDLPTEEQSEYKSWCKYLLQISWDLRATVVSPKLLALRRFRQDGVPLACTIQAIRDFVYFDLTASNVIPDVQKVGKAVKESSNRVRTLYQKCDDLGVKQVAELSSYTDRVSSFELWQDKESLTLLAKGVFQTMKEIYEYEQKRLSETNGDSFSWAQAQHLEFMLPPGLTSNSHGYRTELATLFNAAKQVWRQGAKKVRGTSRIYTEDALQKLLERFTVEERRKFREHLSAGIPNMFPRIYDLGIEEARELIAEKASFHPSAKAAETIKIARAIRDGLIKFEPVPKAK